MAKDPAFLFYTGDFSTGTQFFSDEQVGKYLRLLMAQHQHGHLSEKQMLLICKTYDNDIWSKFTKDPEGKYYQSRLEYEATRRKSFTESRAKNRIGFKKIKKSIPKKKSLTYENHMENEIKNKNRIKIEDEIESRKIVFAEKVNKLGSTYQVPMLKEFCEYWCERSEGATKLRYEKQDAFDIARRLGTWAKNQNKFSKNGQLSKQDAVSAHNEDQLRRVLDGTL